MHHQGAPEVMQDDPRYDDVLVEVYLWLEERIAAAEEAGIARERILIDPGFGFGKNVGHNLELMNGLALFHSLGCPLVVGASRKRTIGALSDEAPADQRLGGSIAFALKAVEQGAQISASTMCRKRCRRCASGAACATRRCAAADGRRVDPGHGEAYSGRSYAAQAAVSIPRSPSLR